MDSQSVKTVEESAGIRGDDAHICVKGRKRHLLVDMLGRPIACYGMPMSTTPWARAARKLLGGIAFFVPRLKTIWADAASRGKELADWCQQQGGWELEVAEREPGTQGFQVQPQRWVVERSFVWLSRNRRLAKDYVRQVQTSETLIEVSVTRLVRRRLVGRRPNTASRSP
jgi:putative transposase